MEYWKECIEGSFEDAGITATKEQIDVVAGWIEGAHENFGLATGRDFIPNPLLGELEDARREIARQQKNHDRQLLGIRRGVASRRNVDVSGVSINDAGEVTYER